MEIYFFIAVLFLFSHENLGFRIGVILFVWLLFLSFKEKGRHAWILRVRYIEYYDRTSFLAMSVTAISALKISLFNVGISILDGLYLSIIILIMHIYRICRIFFSIIG